jgi:hypothetical protein
VARDFYGRQIVMSVSRQSVSTAWVDCPPRACALVACRQSFPSLFAISRISRGRKKFWLCVTCAFAVRTTVTLADGIEHMKTNPIAAVQIDQLDATLQRPLFSSARHRPPPAAAPVAQQVQAPAPPPAPPNLTLLGVLMERQGLRAIVQPDAPNKIRMVKIGDEIGGWKVSVIEPRELILAQEERSSTFSLFKAPSPAGKSNRRSH